MQHIMELHFSIANYVAISHHFEYNIQSYVDTTAEPNNAMISKQITNLLQSLHHIKRSTEV